MIKIYGEEVPFKHFNDGTLRLKFSPSSTYNGCRITWLFDTEEEFSNLFYLVNHLRESYKMSPIALDMWYLPEARMDRQKENNECFTLKYFCKFINSLHFDEVKIFDPHSYVGIALLDNVKVEKPQREILYLLDKYPNATLFFVDEGGQKRYKDIIGDNYFAFGVKDREWSTQNINSLQIMGAKHMLSGHDILIIDDIISRGSSIYLAAKQLKEIGCNNIYVWASHCENTVLQPHINGVSLVEIPNLITKIYTTNSIYRSKHPKIEIIKEF